MSTQALTTTDRLRDAAVVRATDPYPLGQILGIWASVALPMGFLWVVMPILVPRLSVHLGFLFLVLITFGLVWQEHSNDRPWLRTPTNPQDRPSIAQEAPLAHTAARLEASLWASVTP